MSEYTIISGVTTREQKLQKIASACGIPAEDLQDLAKENKHLPPDLFGDPINKKYPLNNKKACLASMAEFSFDSDGSPVSGYVKDRISKAASHYGLEWPILQKKYNTDKFSVTESGSVWSINVSPTSKSIEKAAGDLFSSRSQMSHCTCRDIARYLVKYAAKNDLDLEESCGIRLMKLAGYGIAEKADVLDAVSKRASLNTNNEVSKKMTEYTDSLIRNLPDVVDSETLDKIAEVLDAYDSYGQHKDSYGLYLECPEEALFSKTAKDAAGILSEIVYIESVDADVSREDLVKNASMIVPILASFGIDADETTVVEKVANLNKDQANTLFSLL